MTKEDSNVLLAANLEQAQKKQNLLLRVSFNVVTLVVEKKYFSALEATASCNGVIQPSCYQICTN